MPWTQTTFRYTIPLFHQRKEKCELRILSVGQAIDLMTRRLIVSGRSSAAVGTYFSLGHSTYVTPSPPSQCENKKEKGFCYEIFFIVLY